MDDGIKILIENNAIIDIKPLDEHKKYILPDEDIDLNVYRIILLIYALGHSNKVIEFYGKHKLILYDFLLKYPENIVKVANLKNKSKLLYENNIEINSKEAWKLEKIKEYVYSSKIYNNYFNYLISKDLINLCYKKRIKSGENEFCIILTEKGTEIGQKIYSNESEWVYLIKLINKIFTNRCTDKGIMNFVNEQLIGEDEYNDD